MQSRKRQQPATEMPLLSATVVLDVNIQRDMTDLHVLDIPGGQIDTFEQLFGCQTSCEC
jgi:hypothetical protein